MTPHPLAKPSLGLAALVALGIGSTLAFAPDALYRSYGVTEPLFAEVANDTRGTGLALLAMAGMLIAGIVRAAWTRTALAVGALVYLAYAGGRLIGWALDGVFPAASQLSFGIEVAVGVLCLWVVTRAPRAA